MTKHWLLKFCIIAPLAMSCAQPVQQASDTAYANANSNGKGKGSRAGSDREIPGYLVGTPDWLHTFLFPEGSPITPVAFPKVLPSYVTRHDLGDLAAISLSQPIDLQIADNLGYPPSVVEQSLTLVQICSKAPGISAQTGVVFLDEKIFVAPSQLNFDGKRACFARMLNTFFQRATIVFIQTKNGASPAGFTPVDAVADPASALAEWTSDVGDVRVEFSPAIETQFNRHAIGIASMDSAVSTCAGGIFAIKETDEAEHEFREINAGRKLAIRVCTIDGLGFASKGTEFFLDAWREEEEETPGGFNGMHLVFVTSRTFNGNLGGLRGADMKCQTEAAAAGLSGNWKAILSSSSESAKDRLRIAGEIYNLANQRVTASATALWSTDTGLDNAIAFSANAMEVDHGTTEVWTGSNSDGSSSITIDCHAWSTSIDQGSVGMMGSIWGVARSWLSEGIAASCNVELRLYCINGQ